jgi:hypothetical protein
MSGDHIGVDGHTGLVRSSNSGAIININKDEIQKAREVKMKKRRRKSEFQELRQDVDELKVLLNKLVEKL